MLRHLQRYTEHSCQLQYFLGHHATILHLQCSRLHIHSTLGPLTMTHHMGTDSILHRHHTTDRHRSLKRRCPAVPLQPGTVCTLAIGPSRRLLVYLF